MQESEIHFVGIGELLSLQAAAKKGARQIIEADLSIIKDAAMVCRQGRIHWLGRERDLPVSTTAKKVSLNGRTVLPGFVECHTHLAFAGNRAEEFEWRIQGQTYAEISAKGGGILSTVRATRQASEEDLFAVTQARAQKFVAQGVTALEVKSGYGLDLETEKRQLRVARQILGPEIVTTYLGAHSRSPDFAELADYVTYMSEKVMPAIRQENLADRVDIYIEKGFYDLSLAKRYFSRARELGWPITAHVEQLSDFGGTDLALGAGAQSVDHLVFANAKTIALLAKSSTTAVLLPTSDLYLCMPYPPARAMLAAGARVAVSTDFNPGTSPTQDLSVVGVLARLEMKMSLPEIIVAYTLGAAYALGRQNDWGSLEPEKECHFIAIDGNWRDLFYAIGHHPVKAVYRSGQPIYFSQ